LALSNSKAEFRSGDKPANCQAQGKIFDESPHQNTVNGSLSGWSTAALRRAGHAKPICSFD
jgi:hypothetical protein